mgnify:CR=1 FL=1
MIIFWFLILLTVIVFVHEMGHYLIARINGVKVDVFSIGFGSEVFGWYDKLGTRWKICIIPLGGYVKFFGDANLASSLSDKSIQKLNKKDLYKTFISKSLLQKSAIVFAGPLANFIFAIIVFFLLFMVNGVVKDVTVLNVVDNVVTGSPAYKSGFTTDDIIVKIDNINTNNFSDIKEIVEKNPNNELAITIIRYGREKILLVTPELKEIVNFEGEKSYVGRIGIAPKFEINYENIGFLASIKKAFSDTFIFTYKTFEGISEILTGKRSASELGGPIMIANVAGEAADNGIQNFLFIMAIISINLGLINLFPIPLLDGGHLFLFLIQALKGSPINENFLKYYSMLGLVILIGLMILVNYNDLFKLFN